MVADILRSQYNVVRASRILNQQRVGGDDDPGDGLRGTARQSHDSVGSRTCQVPNKWHFLSDQAKRALAKPSHLPYVWSRDLPTDATYDGKYKRFALPEREGGTTEALRGKVKLVAVRARRERADLPSGNLAVF